MSSEQCRIKKATCANNEMIRATKAFLKGADSNSILSSLSPYTEEERRQIEAALEDYQIECDRCARVGNDADCMDQINRNYTRRLPWNMRKIYPWKNYDWDYATLAENKYSPDALPPGSKGSFAGLIREIQNSSSVINGLIRDKNPNSNSSPNRRTRDGDFSVFKARQRGIEGIAYRETADIKDRYKQPAPYIEDHNRNFFNKDLRGEGSSSFFFQIGYCPRYDIKDEKECKRRGYKWDENRIEPANSLCSEPRYAFVDNKSRPFINGSRLAGQLPSIANNVKDMMSVDLLAGMMETSTGRLEIMQCPPLPKPAEEIEEGFVERPKREKNWMGITPLVPTIPIDNSTIFALFFAAGLMIYIAWVFFRDAKIKIHPRK